MVDIPFTNYQFPTNPVIGATMLRSMPVRLAEVKNVLDFGADPTGGSDSRAAIQAAVDWTTGPNRGTIYFPMGSYLVGAPGIQYNYDGDLSICFRGEIGTTINASPNGVGFNGYIFDRKLVTPNNTRGGRIFERLTISNVHANGGCIRMGSTIGGAVRDCNIGATIGVTTEDAVGVSSKNISIQNCKFTGTATSIAGIIIGGGGVIENCNIIGCGHGATAYGSGLHIAGNRSERCNSVWALGQDSAGNPVGLSGFTITSSTYEGNWYVFDLVGPCEGFYIGSHASQGHDSTNAGVTPGIKGTQGCIRIAANCAKNGVFHGFKVSSTIEDAGVDIANATSRTNLVFSCMSVFVGGGGGIPWRLPTNAYTAIFEECEINPVWTFAQLPSGANVFEGDEFDINDGTDGLTWGQTATNTGSHTTHYRVRWNGTNWTVMGK